MQLSKKLPEINAGSMADIAFLLLVFFLVTTTIQQDQGLRVSLPQWVEDEDHIQDVHVINVLQVVITANDQLFVNGKKFESEDLTEYARGFVLNNGKDPNLSQSPRHARVLLTNDNGCSYDLYLRVSNEIYAAYHEIWEQAAKADYGKGWDRLTAAEQGSVKEKFPRAIIETETEF